MATTDYHKTKASLQDFLAKYQKMAEDPNRKALEPEDVKEGKPQTTEVDKGDGGTAVQGEAGKETAAETKKSVPEGTGVEDGPVNSGPNPDMEQAKATGTSPVTTTASPDEDIEAMKNVDPAVKKAFAQQIILESRIMDILDRQFNELAAKNANQQAEKEVEEKTAEKVVSKEAAEAQLAARIIESAEQHKMAHVKGLMEATGCTAKEANDILNAVADEDPSAILPAETLSDEDAEAILAEAAELDAAEAAEATGETGEAAGEAGEAAVSEDVQAEELEAALAPVIAELQEAGYGDQEILQAILEEGGITEEDLVDAAVEQLVSEGLTEEESMQVIEELAELQANGATPEDLAAILSGEAGE